MTAVTKKTVFDKLIESRIDRENARDPVAEILLEELNDPRKALVKINGSAVKYPTPDHVPSLSEHRSLEDLTGFGAFDPVEAAGNPRERDEQRALKLEIKAARIRAGLDQTTTVGEVSAYRALCCYRIVRELARIKGHIGAEESLADVKLFESPQFADYRTKNVTGKDLWNDLGSEPLYKARKTTVMPILETIRELESCLELPIPYEPPFKDEELTDSFVYVIEEVADSLYIRRGSTVLPDYGEYGLKGLFKRELVRLLWPSRHELVTLEYMLIDELIRELTEKGEIQARKHLVIKYGFMQHEALELLHLALRKTKDRVISDTEIVRAKMVLRLEHLAQEASESCDVRAELAAFRLLAQITGLLVEVEDDKVESLVGAIRKLQENREERQGEIIAENMAD